MAHSDVRRVSGDLQECEEAAKAELADLADSYERLLQENNRLNQEFLREQMTAQGLRRANSEMKRAGRTQQQGHARDAGSSSPSAHVRGTRTPNSNGKDPASCLPQSMAHPLQS